MKRIMMLLLVVGAIHSQAQMYNNDLVQGDGGTKIVVQKDLARIAQDEEVSTINVLHKSSSEACRIESLSSEIKKGTVFHLGYIYHSSSNPGTTVDLISENGMVKASIECTDRREYGISFYNSELGEALLMSN